MLPLDHFEVKNGKLQFKDPGGSGRYKITWSIFNNDSVATTPVPGATTFHAPPKAGHYLAASISDGSQTATVYLGDGFVAGVRR